MYSIQEFYPRKSTISKQMFEHGTWPHATNMFQSTGPLCKFYWWSLYGQQRTNLGSNKSRRNEKMPLRLYLQTLVLGAPHHRTKNRISTISMRSLRHIHSKMKWHFMGSSHTPSQCVSIKLGKYSLKHFLMVLFHH